MNVNIPHLLSLLAQSNFAAVFSQLDAIYTQNKVYERIKKEYLLGGLTGLQLDDLKERLTTHLQTGFFEQKIAIGRPPRNTKFVGRESELKEVHRLLQENNRVAIVKGFGGIGKTTLAIEYLHRYEGKYEGYLYVHKTGAWLSLFTENWELLTFLGLQEFKVTDTLTQNYNELLFAQIKKDLYRATGNYLLLIDDVQADISDALAALDLGKAWKILCTSREEFTGLKTVDLGFLPLKELYLLFTQIYDLEKDEQKINNILLTLGRHTLSIELLAHIAQTKRWSLDELISKLAEEKFELKHYKQAQEVFHVKNSPVTFETVNQYLLKIFHLADFTPDEKKLLSQFCLLPSIFTHYILLEFLFCENKKNEEEVEIFQNTLYQLRDKGCLFYDKTEDSYSLHTVFSTLLFQHFQLDFAFAAPVIDRTNTLTYKILQKNWTEISFVLPYLTHFIKKWAISFSITQGLNPALWKTKLTTSDSPLYATLATTLNNTGYYYNNQGNYNEALSYYQQAIEIWKEVLGEKHPDLATSYNNIGNLYNNQGNYDEALSYYQQAIEIWKEVLGEKHPNLAGSYNNIGSLYKNQGNYAEALTYYKQAMKIWKEVLGEKHPNLAVSYNNIGNLYNNQGNYAEALTYYEKAMEIWKEILGEKHPSLATSYNNIGELYRNQGNYDEALIYNQQAMEIRKEVLGEKHPDLAGSYNNLGLLYQSQGNYDEALTYYEQAMKIRKEILGEKHPGLATSYHNLAGLYAEIGEITKAIAYEQKALSILTDTLPETHEYIKISKRDLAIYVFMQEKGIKNKAEYWEYVEKINKK